MPWTGGTTRTTGDIVSAAMWNNHWGAGGDADTISDGSKIEVDLVAMTSLLEGSGRVGPGLEVSYDSDNSGFDNKPHHLNRNIVGDIYG